MRMRSEHGAVLVLFLAVFGCGDDTPGEQTTARSMIGAEGGELTLSGGVKVEIPPDALTTRTEIKITKLALEDVAPLPFNLAPAGKPFAFEPHGLQFSRPVKITLPFDDADAELRPVKLDDGADTTWQTSVGAEKDDDAKELRLETASFSIYLAARPIRTTGVVTLPDGAIDDGAVSGTGGTGGMAGSGGTAGGGGAMDAGMDAAMPPMDAGVDATAQQDAGVDAGSASPTEAVLTASNRESNDQFGVSVAIDGDTIVVGARMEDSNATGVNGDGANNAFSAAGAAYVFVRNGASWTQQAYLKSASPGAMDWFGASVAISGDTIVVGVPQEDSDATGIDGDGDGANNNASNAGAAYVFVRSGTTWTQQAYLKASNTGADDGFGISVAIDGDIILVGADGEDSNATGVDGVQANDSITNSGAAYVFERTGTTWSQAAYLKVGYSEATDDDHFGCSVAVSGTSVAVGAYFRERGANGINGNEQVITGSRGAAFVFTRTAGVWAREAFIRPASNPNRFGEALALRGDVLVVGDPTNPSAATGVGGDPSNTGATASGAAFVFTRAAGVWTETAFLKASNTGVNDGFGGHVAIGTDTIFVGASGEDSSTTGVGGTLFDDGALESGAAYLFRFDGQAWSGPTYYKADDPDATDQYGIGVAASGDTLVVGSFLEDVGANNAGAAYVYRVVTP